MKTIYEELIERVSNGEKFNIDFENRHIKVSNKYLVKNGEYDTSKYKLFNEYNADINSILSDIEALYEVYKYSMISERSENKRRKYFKALPIEELTDEQLVIGQPREVSQANLEGFIFVQILSGNLYWDEKIMNGKWFYQGNDPDLIILKKWIEK